MFRSIILALLTTPTFAHANAAGGFDPMSLLPIVLIFVVFYFLLLRPQQQKAKAHQALLQNLRRGDKVVTAGGIIGSVHKIISENEVIIEAEDQVKLRMVKSMISEVLTKTEPVTTAEVKEFPKAISTNASEEKKGKPAAKKPAAKKPSSATKGKK